MDFQIDGNPNNADSTPTQDVNPVALRLTPARQTVVDILEATEQALTHHEIEQRAHAKGVQFDRVTLYRALEWLVSRHLANKVAAEDRIWRFSAARANAAALAYFHCTTCGGVYCLTPPAGDIVAVPAGFQPVRTEIMLRGVCSKPGCQG
jgi:Fur family ferric uptake transcriptional regulator